MRKSIKKRIYMDYAAAAPELPSVRRATKRAAQYFANPSSIHTDGVRSATALANAHADIAKILSAHADEIVCVGSGTESDNLAVMGVFKHARLSSEFKGKDVHIITSAIEHPAILEACRHIEEVGGQVTYLAVDKDGRIDLKEFCAALRPETILVSIAYANNEIGVIQPIREIAKEIRHYKKSLHSSSTSNLETRTYPLFHTDACQAAAYLNLTVEQLGVDLLTLNGTKLGGPRGTGLLYMRRGTPIAPIMHGGGQERGIRPGTENIPGIVGLAEALVDAAAVKDTESARLTAVRDFFIEEIKKHFPAARINGSLLYRLPNNVHVSFPKIKSELLVLELDAKGISASAGSACSSAADTGSHVLEAMHGKADESMWGSVRFSFGRNTKKSDITGVIHALSAVFKKYNPWITA